MPIPRTAAQALCGAMVQASQHTQLAHPGLCSTKPCRHATGQLMSNVLHRPVPVLAQAAPHPHPHPALPQHLLCHHPHPHPLRHLLPQLAAAALLGLLSRVDLVEQVLAGCAVQLVSSAATQLACCCSLAGEPAWRSAPSMHSCQHHHAACLLAKSVSLLISSCCGVAAVSFDLMSSWAENQQCLDCWKAMKRHGWLLQQGCYLIS